MRKAGMCAKTHIKRSLHWPNFVSNGPAALSLEQVRNADTLASFVAQQDSQAVCTYLDT